MTSTPYNYYLQFRQIFALLLLVWGSTACSEEIFDEQRPYAIQIGKYRSLTDAHNTMDRLESMGIAPYLVRKETESEGAWHLILSGSFEHLEDAMAQKIRYEDSNGLLNIEIVNYNLLSPELTDFDAEAPAADLIDAQQPELPREVYNTLKRFPFSRSFQLQSAQLISTLDSVDVNVMRFASMQSVVPDLPRGIVPDRFISHTEVLAEAVYEDELIGGNFTAHVIKFKKEHPYGSNIAEYFAKTIKDTREYSFEEMLPIEVGAGTNLGGYAVNIEPRKGRIRRYLVLSDPNDSTFLYFIQSAKTKEQQMEAFASYLNYENGLTGYHHFHNTLYTLPSTIDGNNHLIYFQMQKLQRQSGRTASLTNGFVKAKSVFFNEEKGVWEYELQKLQDPEKGAQVFAKQYPALRNKDSVAVQGNPAWLAKARRRDRDNKKWVDLADELQFYVQGNIGVISNKRRAWLSQEEMMAFANRLQLQTGLKEEKTGLFW